MVDNQVVGSSPVRAAYAAGNLSDQALLLAGNAAGAIDQFALYGKALTTSTPPLGEALLKAIRSVTRQPVRRVIVSHYHADHTGQVASFPNSTLLIGQGDWNAITQPKPAAGVNAGPFAHWISGAGKMEALPADKDVFGDGSVMILNTPGHTPGHHSLLVKLRERGNFLITGDLVHFHENYNSNGVPWFNVSRADSLASIDRFKQIAMNHRAKVIIQHDARDIGILPAWPAGAK